MNRFQFYCCAVYQWPVSHHHRLTNASKKYAPRIIIRFALQTQRMLTKRSHSVMTDCVLKVYNCEKNASKYWIEMEFIFFQPQRMLKYSVLNFSVAQHYPRWAKANVGMAHQFVCLEIANCWQHACSNGPHTKSRKITSLLFVVNGMAKKKLFEIIYWLF